MMILLAHSREGELVTRLVMDYDFHRLECEIEEFNILEAPGALRQELRYFDFLTFLIGPAGKHYMGDSFLES